MSEVQALVRKLTDTGVAGVTVAWCDNSGVPRSRTVPVAALPEVVRTGIGVTSLFAVFDSADAITFDHPGLATPSGDVRLIPVLDGLTRLAGQPALAWAPGRQVAADGTPWPYDQRGVLERQVARLAEDGLSALVGYEIEFTVSVGDGDAVTPAHPGPAYSPHALVGLDGFVASVLRDFDANGLRIHQLHAEYGPAQMELSLAATDPVRAADRQLLARQTLHAAARAHGLRLSLAPLPTLAGAGNGWHVHSSVWRDGRNLLAGTSDHPGPDGAGWGAGLLRDLP
ncbi:MAG: glutamine synthetase, partial [Pseudonocardia sp.]